MNAFHPDYPLGTSDYPKTRKVGGMGEHPFVPVEDIVDPTENPEEKLIRQEQEEKMIRQVQRKEQELGNELERIYDGVPTDPTLVTGLKAERAHQVILPGNPVKGNRQSGGDRTGLRRQVVVKQGFIENSQQSRRGKPPSQTPKYKNKSGESIRHHQGK